MHLECHRIQYCCNVWSPYANHRCIMPRRSFTKYVFFEVVVHIAQRKARKMLRQTAWEREISVANSVHDATYVWYGDVDLPVYIHWFLLAIADDQILSPVLGAVVSRILVGKPSKRAEFSHHVIAHESQQYIIALSMFSMKFNVQKYDSDMRFFSHNHNLLLRKKRADSGHWLLA